MAVRLRGSLREFRFSSDSPTPIENPPTSYLASVPTFRSLPSERYLHSSLRWKPLEGTPSKGPVPAGIMVPDPSPSLRGGTHPDDTPSTDVSTTGSWPHRRRRGEFIGRPPVMHLFQRTSDSEAISQSSHSDISGLEFLSDDDRPPVMQPMPQLQRDTSSRITSQSSNPSRPDGTLHREDPFIDSHTPPGSEEMLQNTRDSNMPYSQLQIAGPRYQSVFEPLEKSATTRSIDYTISSAYAQAQAESDPKAAPEIDGSAGSGDHLSEKTCPKSDQEATRGSSKRLGKLRARVSQFFHKDLESFSPLDAAPEPSEPKLPTKRKSRLWLPIVFLGKEGDKKPLLTSRKDSGKDSQTATPSMSGTSTTPADGSGTTDPTSLAPTATAEPNVVKLEAATDAAVSPKKRDTELPLVSVQDKGKRPESVGPSIPPRAGSAPRSRVFSFASNMSDEFNVIGNAATDATANTDKSSRKRARKNALAKWMKRAGKGALRSRAKE